MENKGLFKEILRFTVKKEKIVLTQIVTVSLKKLFCLIELLFIAQTARNNKVDPIKACIYTNYKMPNTKSAVRRVRRVKKQSLVNRIRKSKYKSAIKQMDQLIKSKDKEKAKKYFPKFQSILMQVAKSGVVNKKTAARKISRASKKI